MRAAFCQIVTARRYGVGIFNNRVSNKSGGEKRPSRFSFIGDARRFLRGELRAPRSLQVARGTSHFVLVASGAGNFALRARCKFRGELRFIQCTARMPCRILAQQPRIFAQQKYGSEGYTDVPRTTTARICSNKSGGEKRPSRFSFIGDARRFLRTARNLSALI